MKIIYNKHFPFGPFLATNLFGVIFARSDKRRLTDIDINHEYIHTLQQRELGFVGFMLWYSIEWFINFLKYRNNMQAYYHIRFEREAYDHERDLNYSSHRRPYEWWYLYTKPHSFLHELGSMIGDVASFIRDDFRWPKYLAVLLMAITLMVAQTQFDFYGHVMQPSYDAGTAMLVIPAVYITIYYTAMLATVLLHGESWRLKQWQVWIFPALLLMISGSGQGFEAYKHWIPQITQQSNEAHYLYIVSAYLFRSVGIVGALCLFRWATTGRFGLYGMTRSSKYLKVYALIYLLLIPLFTFVSFTPQFLSFYPKMDIMECEGSFGLSNWQLISIFELSYANDFVGVESMFRGALVIGMGRWLGPRAVLPMILAYMSIHLGKPDMEMASSILGGYLLGILAYRTNHLWGGIIIHIGIALFFEAMGLARILW